MADSHDHVIGMLSEAVRQLQKSVEGLTTQVDNVQTTLAEARGGWRTLMWLGGAAGIIGTIVGSYLDHLISALRGFQK